MGIEFGRVCLGVCVCLFLFIDEIDSWMCVLCLCARAGASGLFSPFRLCGKLKGQVAEGDRRKYFPIHPRESSSGPTLFITLIIIV